MKNIILIVLMALFFADVYSSLGSEHYKPHLPSCFVMERTSSKYPLSSGPSPVLASYNSSSSSSSSSGEFPSREALRNEGSKRNRKK